MLADLNGSSPLTQEQHDNVIEIGNAVADPPGNQNFTLNFLASSLVNFSKGKPVSIDLTPILSDRVDPTSELYKLPNNISS